MKFIGCISRLGIIIITVGLIGIGLSGCATTEQNIALSAILGTSYLARTPTTEIEQTYYLGSFDPQEQVPPTIYRVRVHGQASAISSTKFASGWVKSELVDSLGSSMDFGGKSDGPICIQGTAEGKGASLNAGRRLVMFGPEGFREAPKDHRLVIVMGSSPESYFQAIDESLGAISEVKAKAASDDISRRLYQALFKMDNEKERLNSLEKDIAVELPDDSAKTEGI